MQRVHLYALVATLGSFLLGCAPTHRSTTVVGTQPVRLGRRMTGPPKHEVKMRGVRGTVVLSVTSSQDCEVTERADTIVEEHDERDASLGLIIPGGAIALWGMTMLLSPGPSCNEVRRENPDAWCLVDEKEMDQGIGAFLTLVGGVLVVGGLATIEDKTRETIEPGPESTHVEENCVRNAGANLPVTLVLEDGQELRGVTSASGVVTIPIDPKTWASSGPALRGSVYVQGALIRPFELRPVAPKNP
jgi:hypothetical protein